MEGLDQIDRQLEARGHSAPDTRALLEQVLGQDRSLARLDELLAGLGAAPPSAPASRAASSRPPRRKSGWPAPAPTPAPARATPLPAAMPVGFSLPLDPLAPVAAQPAAPSSPSWPPTAVRSSPLPPRIVTPMPSAPPPSVPAPSAPPASVPAPSATSWPPQPAAMPRITDTLVDTPLSPLPAVVPSEEDLDAETAALLGEAQSPPYAMPSAVPLPFGPSVEPMAAEAEVPTRVGPAPADNDQAAEERQMRERRESVRALLDRALDPSDFPGRNSAPPRADQLAADHASAEVQSDDDGVEMLLEDDEIIEIEDDEFEEVE